MAVKKQAVPRTSSTVGSSGYGFNFEHSIQSFFVVQMFTGGFIPKMGLHKIKRIVPQATRFGRATDDCELTLVDESTLSETSLLVQVKKTFNVTKENGDFEKVIRKAWEDFNKNGFDRQKDKIMLVAGDLNSNGIGLKLMLQHIQAAYKYSNHFWENYNKSSLGRSSAENKAFSILLDKLKEINDGIAPNNNDIFQFCKVFCVVRSDMHDANFDNGDMNLALVHSTLSRYRWLNNATPLDIWRNVHSYISEMNQHAPEILLDDLPDELSKIFSVEKATTQQPFTADTTRPSEYKLGSSSELVIKTEWKKELALLCIIGGFDYSNDNDLSVIEDIFGQSRSDILEIVQAISSTDDGIIALNNTTWSIRSPKETLSSLTSFIYDNHIESIGKSYVTVLGEIDPALDLSVHDRHMASFYNKSYSYSATLRSGLAEGMAILAINHQKFNNCSLSKISNMAISLVESLLSDSKNYAVWSSLSDNMEAIAWTAPKKFLSTIEYVADITFDETPLKALATDSSTDTFFGKDYFSGLRRALLSLAKDSSYFVRATISLASLAYYEIGETVSSKRSLESVVEIILPWYPKTQASVSARYTAIDKILKNNRGHGRFIIKKLLPGVTQTTSGDDVLPWLIDPSDDTKEKHVTRQEVYEQSSYYSTLFIENSDSIEEIIDIIEVIDHLTDDAMDDFTKKIDSTTSVFNSADRLAVWNALLQQSRHLNRKRGKKRSSLSNWAEITQSLADKIAPEDILDKNIYLFNSYDHDLIDSENWETGEKKIRARRQEALIQIINSKGMSGLKLLIESAKLPHIIGQTLGSINEDTLSVNVLPELIKYEGPYEAFYRTYIYIRGVDHKDDIKSWTKKMNFGKWLDEEKIKFILSLPLVQSSWSLFEHENPTIEKEYWSRVSDFVSISQTGYSSYAVGELLKADRPLAALECIYWSSFAANNKDLAKIDKDQILDALLSSMNTDENVIEYNRLNHEVGTIFKYLHESIDISNTDLWKAEWAYLGIFTKQGSLIPKALIRHVIDSPDFFCELVQMGYKSSTSKEESPKEIPESIQRNLLRLLSFNDFPIALGVSKDGVFNENQLNDWISRAEDLCRKTGHLEVARSIIGGYLVNAPADADGTWIDKAVLRVLDREDAREMREGYNTGIYNSRGIHSVDSSGSDESALRDLWSERATLAEEKGYINVAESLRDLAAGYDYHRERVVRRFDSLS